MSVGRKAVGLSPTGKSLPLIAGKRRRALRTPTELAPNLFRGLEPVTRFPFTALSDERRAGVDVVHPLAASEGGGNPQSGTDGDSADNTSMPTPAERDDQETQAVPANPARGGKDAVVGDLAPVPGDPQYDPYPDPNRPGVARVPVKTDHHTEMDAIIDAEDLPLVRDKRWNWSPGKPGCPGSVVGSNR